MVALSPNFAYRSNDTTSEVDDVTQGMERDYLADQKCNLEPYANIIINTHVLISLRDNNANSLFS